MIAWRNPECCGFLQGVRGTGGDERGGSYLAASYPLDSWSVPRSVDTILSFRAGVRGGLSEEKPHLAIIRPGASCPRANAPRLTRLPDHPSRTRHWRGLRRLPNSCEAWRYGRDQLRLLRRAVVDTVPIDRVGQRLMEFASAEICSARCPHCGATNVFRGFTVIEAFVCQ